MSQLEVASNSSPLYAYTFQALGSSGADPGTQVSSNVAVNVPANLFVSCSKIVGCVAQANAGLGRPDCRIQLVQNSAGAGYVPQLFIASSVNTDITTYTVYWYNEVANSQYRAMLPC
jgi:hypothetical protein